MTDPTEPGAALLGRRRVLQVAGVTGVAGVLAACQTYGAETAAPPEDDSAPDDQPDDQAADGGEPEDGGEGDDGGGAAEVLAAAGDVPVGGGVIVGGVVVTQAADGDFRAFSSTCTHQGCTVSGVADGIISCPCHGSQFSAEDGSVQGGPAPEPLPEVGISVEGDQILRS